ncbi:MAG: hypothetical protein EPO40_08305 [Myxococcaceae bacterium]|nr:MAG: hypothetical protein EPO40_08305 [Myxococcaceae bacterium]
MSNPHSNNDAPANPSQQKAHAALDEIERVGARSRLTIRAGIKAGAASVRPAVCYGCAPPDL